MKFMSGYKMVARVSSRIWMLRLVTRQDILPMRIEFVSGSSRPEGLSPESGTIR